MSKGSKRRPKFVSDDEYDKRYIKAFNKYYCVWCEREIARPSYHDGKVVCDKCKEELLEIKFD